MSNAQIIPILCERSDQRIPAARVRPLGGAEVVLPFVVAYSDDAGDLIGREDTRPLAQLDQIAKKHFIAQLGMLRWSTYDIDGHDVHLLVGHQFVSGVLAMTRIRKQLQARLGEVRGYVAAPAADVIIASTDSAVIAQEAARRLHEAPAHTRLSAVPVVMENAECIGTVAVKESSAPVAASSITDVMIPALALLVSCDEVSDGVVDAFAHKLTSFSGRFHKLFHVAGDQLRDHIAFLADRDSAADLQQAVDSMAQRVESDRCRAFNKTCIDLVTTLDKQFDLTGLDRARRLLPTVQGTRRVTRSMSTPGPVKKASSAARQAISDDGPIVVETPTGGRQVMLPCESPALSGVEQSVRQAIQQHGSSLVRIKGFDGTCRVLVSVGEVVDPVMFEARCQRVSATLNDDPNVNSHVLEDGTPLRVELIAET